MKGEHGARAIRALARVDTPFAGNMFLVSCPDTPDGTGRAFGQVAIEVDFDRDGGYVLRIDDHFADVVGLSPDDPAASVARAGGTARDLLDDIHALIAHVEAVERKTPPAAKERAALTLLCAHRAAPGPVEGQR